MTRGPALVATLAAHPRRLFLLDGAGALVTAGAVGLGLPSLGPHLVGMDAAVLRALAAAACAVAVWSLAWAALAPRRWPWGLYGTALMNAGYCAVTAACLWRFRAALRPLDWIYFPGEIALVAALAAVEWRVAASGRRRERPGRRSRRSAGMTGRTR